MAESSSGPPLFLTTAILYGAAVSALSLPPPHLSETCPVSPPPSSIPRSKLIPKTRFIVDGFRYAESGFSVSYFLSHFHSDHYTGLTPQWSKGIIYCSSTTANLLHQILEIPRPFIRALPLDQRVMIDGSEVWLVDANHCPGAVQFLFKVPVNPCKDSISRFEKYVHTGDFRYTEEMKNAGVISEFIGSDAVFLDTTYCNPKFVFPSQEESIDYIVKVIEKEKFGMNADNNVLFLVATYVIGKERILMEISHRCNMKIYVSNRKMTVLRALELFDMGVFTEDPSESKVHVIGWNVLGETWPYFRPNFVKMKEIMNERGYSRIVGFVPTGWTYEVKKNKFSVRVKDSFEIHLVPYSEHSNYSELREYVKFLKPKRVVPTVGSDVEKLDGKHAKSMLKHFAGLVDEMAIRNEFLKGFLQSETLGTDREDESVSSHTDVIDPGKSSSPQQDLASLDLLSDTKDDDDQEKLVQEVRDCLPSWVTRPQITELLDGAAGNIIEAVSNFYEHETEFYEQAAPHTSVTGTSENEPALPFQSPSVVKSGNASKVFSLNSSSKLSQLNNEKKTVISPGKRPRNKGSKTTKRPKEKNNSSSKQNLITNFFSKKIPLVSTQSEVEVDSDDNRTLSAIGTTNLFEEEVNQFIQIVNGGEPIRSYAATVLERTRGDINMALDTYFNDMGSKTRNDAPESSRPAEAQHSAASLICFEKPDTELSESNKVGGNSGFLYPVLQKANLSVNHILLPPDKYLPIQHACWIKGELAPYIHLARTFDLVEEEKGKLKTTSMLCNMFRSLLALSPEDVRPALYLCTNKIAPDHENMELNIGGSIVVAALEEACGTSRTKINDLYNSLGDLGDVAQILRQTQTLLAPQASLTIQGVYSALRKISSQTGSGSTARKKSLIVNLMRSCREKEIKFLVRTLVRNLRIGAMIRTALPALAQAVVMNSADDVIAKNLKIHNQNLTNAVIEAYHILPSFDTIIPLLIEKGIKFTSSTLSMVPGVPIRPMLAKITDGVHEVLKTFDGRAFTCEYKYDGQRAQIHKLPDGSIRVFSRNGDETTFRFPDLVVIIQDQCIDQAATFILDTEVVAIDRKNNLNLMSFQELSSRDRGSKESLISVDKIKVDICIFAFDVMYANGEQLLDKSLRQRRVYLKDLFRKEKPGFFEYAKEISVEAENADQHDEETKLHIMKSFLDDALRSSCEGIMVKSLDVEAGYSPSKRSNAWLKVKRDYVDGLSDSLDLVPIGAWHGNGRKAGWYSPFLMACYDPDTEEFQSVCRVMSGFSDAFYQEMKVQFSGDKLLPKRPPFYRTREVADVWFSPEVVWEIRGADFTVSPVHCAAFGLVHPSRGISIRFPRFLRCVSDRRPEECSSAADIAHMFTSQTRKMHVRSSDRGHPKVGFPSDEVYRR